MGAYANHGVKVPATEEWEKTMHELRVISIDRKVGLDLTGLRSTA